MRKADPQSDRCYFRTGDRFVSHAGQWWFSVRDGEDQGPFPSREAAELALKRYIESCEFLENLQDDAKPVEQPPSRPPLSIDKSY